MIPRRITSLLAIGGDHDAQSIRQAGRGHGLKGGEVLELLRPLYGLCDSGDTWANTMRQHLIKDLGMVAFVADPSLFFKMEGGKLDGIFGTYVDDSLLAGNSSFLSLSDRTLEKFQSRERETDDFKFSGIEVRTTDDGFMLQQSEYARSIALLPEDCGFEEFRSTRARLAWLTNTRPGICCAVSMSARVTADTFDKQSIRDLNKIVRSARKLSHVGLR